MGFKDIKNSEIFADGKFVQILILSVSFMLIFSAFQTTCMIEQTVLFSVKSEYPTFTGDGYVSLCIIYIVFAIASWVAPSVVAVVASKWSMVVSAAIYVLFIVQFIVPRTWLLYLTSILIGGAAAVLWTGQGNFLTLGSNPKTISRNSGVFWAINQCSLFFGNIFVFFQFQGKTHIDSGTRIFVFSVLTAVAILGVLCLLFLKNLRDADKTDDSISDPSCSKQSSEIGLTGVSDTEKQEKLKETEKEPIAPSKLALNALQEAAKLFITPYMLLLSIASVFTGFGQSFWSGVYPTSVSFTKQFGGDAKRLVGLVGIFTGVGEVFGGTVFGLLGSKTTTKGRSPVVLLGLIISVTCYILMYINIPEEAPIKATNQISVLDPPLPWLAVFCAFLLGFGDACYQTQLFAIFGSVYADKSAAAFAIFKFTQSVASAIGFFSSSYLGMFTQTLTLLVFAVLAFLAILYVEYDTKKKNKGEVKQVETDESVENGKDVIEAKENETGDKSEEMESNNEVKEKL